MEENLTGLRRFRRSTAAYARQLTANPRFDETILILQDDLTGVFTHTLLGEGLLKPSTRIFPYKTAKRLDDRPSESFRRRVTHGAGTLLDAVNMAYLMGWRHIVLVGVDMYDSRLFWGPPDGTLDFNEEGMMVPVTRNDHGIAWNETINTVRNGIIDTLQKWADRFADHGVRLSVYNERSLLTRVLPVYHYVERPPSRADSSGRPRSHA